jgi:acetyl esterase/lipase
VPLRVQRGVLEATARLGRLPAGTRVQAEQLGDRPAERVSGPGADESRAVLLLHGGAFTTCSPRTHRVLAAHLAHAAGAPVHVLDHRRAPEHPHPAAVDDAEVAFRELAAGHDVALAGDSAGGAVAILLALRLLAAGEPPPCAIALISPIADLTLATAEGYRGRDPLLRRSWVRQGAEAYTAGTDPRAVSPLHLDLTGLPPVLVHVSEHERLRPEG